MISRYFLLHTGLLVFAVTSHAEVHFNQQIRPILAENCFHCHGPDPGSRKAGLRLDTEASFFTANDGVTPVVKGDPAKSSLYERLISQDEDEIMPPPETHKQLKPEEIELVRQWIQEGAPWQPHWAFIKPTKVALPTIKDANWPTNAIDHFILNKLESVELTPAPDAEKHALARRVALDLTGLPPSPEVLQAFVQDSSAQAYEKLVDQLLKSTQYGEHRARYWLDAARYGDTHGMHFDNYREMWPYRDWVIQAFNANLPFDQFTVDQIAGDLLPKPTQAQLVATGFQRCNMTTNEGGTIVEENLATYAADRVQTLSWVYLGLTANCSQCHDHKFDPITQKDYYALAAFFRNTTQPGLDGNVKDGKSSIIHVPSAADIPRWEALEREIAQVEKRLAQRVEQNRAPFSAWLGKGSFAQLENQIIQEGLSLHVPLNEGPGKPTQATGAEVKLTGLLNWSTHEIMNQTASFTKDSWLDAGQTTAFKVSDAFSVAFWLKVDEKTKGTIIAKGRVEKEVGFKGWEVSFEGKRLRAMMSQKYKKGANESLAVNSAEKALKPNTWHHIVVTYTGDAAYNGLNLIIDGKLDTNVKRDRATILPTSDITTDAPLTIGRRTGSNFLTNASLRDVRIYKRSLSTTEAEVLAALPQNLKYLATPQFKPNAEQKTKLQLLYAFTQDPEYKKQRSQLVPLESEQSIIRNRSPMTHIQQEKETKAMANVLMRGQYDKLGEEVEAAPPAALHPLPKNAPKNRLGLAQWLVDASNPITPRVTVNRFWQEVFGSGLVKSVDDFGIMGAAPSHPELLDWLAVEFRESGWDVKRLFKIMVMSRTYRQAVHADVAKREKDRDNSLLSRGPRFRMDAEMIRDLALAASGNLSQTQGGPPVRPYQPEGIWDVVGLPGSDTRDYVQDEGEGLYRRTLYNFWKRMAPPPNMETFNAPNREVSCVKRERTNTPLQALVTMNDPQFVEASRTLAQAALKQQAADPIGYIALRLLSRQLSTQEQSILQSSLQDMQKHYEAHPGEAIDLLKVGMFPLDKTLPAAQLAALTLVSSQVMNLDEVLNK